MKRNNANKRRNGIILAVSLVGLTSGLANAGTFTWGLGNGTTGDWNLSTNWNPVGIPSSANADTVSWGGGSTVMVTDAESALRLTVGSSPSSVGFLSVTSTGSLTFGGPANAKLVVSSNSTGQSVAQVDGTLTFDANSAGFSIADNAGSNGLMVVNGTINYNLTGGSGKGPSIGNFGNGTLTINNGATVDLRSQAVATQIEMGMNQGAVSTLNVTGGTLNANLINIRNVANASNPVDAIVNINISGGTANFFATSTSSGIIVSNVATGKISAATLNLSGGTLGLKGPLHATSQSLAGFNWSGGTIKMSQAASTVTFSDAVNLAAGGTGAIFDSNGTTNTMTGTFTGGGSFTKTGAGQLTLSGTNTTTGGITVNQGVLLLTNSQNNFSGGLSVGSGGTLGFTGSSLGTSGVTMANGSTLAASNGGSSATVQGLLTVNGDVSFGLSATHTGRLILGTVDLTGSTRTFTVNNVGNQTPARALDLTAPILNGNLILAGASGNGTERVRMTTVGFGANLTIQSVTLGMGTSFAFNPTMNLIIGANGSLDLGDVASVRTPTVASLSGSGKIINSANPTATSSGELRIVGSATTTFSGTISDGANPLALNGLNLSSAHTGHLTLTTAQPYTGVTTVNGGTLTLASGATLASQTINVGLAGTFDPAAAYPSGFTVAPGFTMTYNGVVVGNIINNGQIKTNSNGPTDQTTLASNFSGSGNYVKTSAGTATFSGAANFPSGLSVSGGLVSFTSTATLNADPINVFSGGTMDVTNLTGGLQIASGKTLAMNGPIIGNIINDGTITVGAANDATYPANISGLGVVTKNNLSTGTSTLTGNVTSTGNISVGGGVLIAKKPLRPVTGSLVVTGPGVSTSLDANNYANPTTYSVAGEFGAVNVGVDGQVGVSTVALTPVARPANKPAVVVTSGVTIGTDGGTSLSGYIDIGNNDMIVKGGSTAALRGYVAAWLGSGVTPVGLGSSFPSPTAPFTTVAVFPNTGSFFSSYDGVSLTASDVIVKFTYFGDTNLDGIIDGADFSNIIEGYSTGGTGWQNGDINYDGVVDATDITAFTNALAYFSDPMNAAPSYGDGTGSAGSNGQVPEPSSLGLLAIASLAALTRKRR